jgi:hypothetical protein
MMRMNHPERASILIGISPVTKEPGNEINVFVPVSAFIAKMPERIAFILTVIIASNPFHFVSTKGMSAMAINAVKINTTASNII